MLKLNGGSLITPSLKGILDGESIRSSPRDGLSTSYRLTKGWLGFVGWVGVVGWVLGPQDFCVIPWHFENGASSKIDYVLAEYVHNYISSLHIHNEMCLK